MRRAKPIGRRSFLLNTGRGMVGLWSEISFGVGSKFMAVALGGSGLATACTPLITPEATVAPGAGGTIPAGADPAEYIRVIADFVNAYVLIRGDEVTLVDTGIPGTGEQFATVLSDAGMGWDAVNHLILTHYHGDHVGAMGEVMEAAENATIYAGAEDIPQIVTSHSIQAVADGDEVFGMQIISTPGHTPGHISVLDPVASFIVLGDAMTNVEGALTGPNERFTADMAVAHESVQKIATFSFETALFGHGEPIESGASAAIAELAATLE